MIEYTYGWESEYVPGDKESNEDDNYVLSAEGQEWDAATLKQLRDEYNIVYNNGCHPILILKEDNEYFLVIGHEDDGRIWFERKYGQFKNRFHVSWAEKLIQNLEEAVKLTGYKNPRSE